MQSSHWYSWILTFHSRQDWSLDTSTLLATSNGLKTLNNLSVPGRSDGHSSNTKMIRISFKPAQQLFQHKPNHNSRHRLLVVAYLASLVEVLKVVQQLKLQAPQLHKHPNLPSQPLHSPLSKVKAFLSDPILSQLSHLLRSSATLDHHQQRHPNLPVLPLPLRSLLLLLLLHRSILKPGRIREKTHSQ